MLVEGFKKAKSSKGTGGVSIFPASFFLQVTPLEIITASQHFNIAVN